MQYFFFSLKGWTGLIANLGIFKGRREINFDGFAKHSRSLTKLKGPTYGYLRT